MCARAHTVTGCFPGADTVFEGIDTVDDCPVVANSALDAAPIATGKIESLVIVGVGAERSEVVDHDVGRCCNVRVLLVQVMDEAVNLGLAEENVVKKVRPPRVPKVKRLTLGPADVRRLLDATDDRFVAAVALCYVQGWRVSEALGLAWQDLDLDEGTVHVRRGSTYADRIGMVLGPTKTARTAGRQLLGPTVIELLRKRQVLQAARKEAAGAGWPEVIYESEHLDLVFTNAAGGPILRQHVDRAIRKAASQIGLDPSQFGTHDGPLGRDQLVRVRRVRA